MGLALEKLPDWPAAMNRDWALAYTGVGSDQMKEWERAGRVRFRPRGPRGSMLALRADLDAALADLFGSEGKGGIEF
ncbi:MAG: hypothetical protein CL949_25045 [Erythrobacter sp.]|nr:hypothetical protein [Erythrobacter sp.]|tara:strand:- start:576 stop:806 length:231 start_codon:yes stop_codon:yes gene_type:complete